MSYCPLKKGLSDCLQDQCEWWDKYGDGCSVRTIIRYLDFEAGFDYAQQGVIDGSVNAGQSEVSRRKVLG